MKMKTNKQAVCLKIKHLEAFSSIGKLLWRDSIRIMASSFLPFSNVYSNRFLLFIYLRKFWIMPAVPGINVS